MDGVFHCLLNLGLVIRVNLGTSVANAVAHVVGVVLQAILGLDLTLVCLIIRLVLLRFLGGEQ